MSEPEPEPPPAERSPAGRSRSVWLTPSGISAMAGVAGVLVVVLGWFIAGRPGFESTPPGDVSSGPTQSETASPANLLFVYGSSSPGQPGYGLIEQYVDRSSRDSVSGVLYDSGRGYPMAKFGPGQPIPGYTLELDPATAKDALRAMTQYEAGLFEPVQVRTKSGRTATAYEWIDATDGYQRIDSWDGSTAHFGTAVALNQFAVGDCFDLGTGGQGTWVSCDSPHQYEVYYGTVFTDEQYPGDVALHTTADSVCEEQFESFVGLSNDVSELGLLPQYPTDFGWTEGDRTLWCAAYLPGGTLTGTMRGWAK
jgi:gamma-glutamylcyclotransferase (GGCT)/AIG2-like uncharacterized protein YtfP